VVVGQQIPLIVQDFAGNAVTQMTTIGIKLSVTPHINVGNKITMDVHPEVSDLSSQATVQGGIIINTTMADTRVMVNDGETAVIGGLIRSNESTTKRGVPILMDIPLIGNLFRSNSTTKAKRELLIFVTPKILTDQNASN
jgi:type II secretory pathway component GspD/PulD (secretin)